MTDRAEDQEKQYDGTMSIVVEVKFPSDRSAPDVVVDAEGTDDPLQMMHLLIMGLSDMLRRTFQARETGEALAAKMMKERGRTPGGVIIPRRFHN